MAKKKNKILVYIEYSGFLFCMLIARILPLRFCYLLASSGSALFYILDSRHRNRAIEHIMHAGLAENREEAAKFAKENFRHFGKVAVEILKMQQLINPGNIKEYIKPAGSEKAIKLFFDSEKPQPAIIVTAHCGNWELAGMGYSILSGNPLLTIMRPFDNPKIGEYVYKMRQGHNHRICPKEGALKPLLSALKKGESVCIIADQHASRTEGVETTFFGHPARTHASPAMLHIRTGVPILVSVSARIGKDFQFEFYSSDPITFKPTGDKEADIKEVTQLFTSAIEELIRKFPEQWMWSHRRWLDINRKKR